MTCLFFLMPGGSVKRFFKIFIFSEIACTYPKMMLEQGIISKCFPVCFGMFFALWASVHLWMNEDT